jgi:hypothetical protein
VLVVRTLRLRMPSSNNVEMMFVQHYLEKGLTGVGMWQLATSRQLCRKSSYKTTIQVGNDAAIETSLVSYCFLLSSIIPQECGSGNDATIKINQDGDDAASRPTIRRFKTATIPQVVLPDDESSRQ